MGVKRNHRMAWNRGVTKTGHEQQAGEERKKSVGAHGRATQRSEEKAWNRAGGGRPELPDHQDGMEEHPHEQAPIPGGTMGVKVLH